MSQNDIGFIMLRHVNSIKTNEYWKECYRCIRRYYPENQIMIIDDNGNYHYISSDFELYNTMIIQSEYSGRGELLPYIYYARNPLFSRALIIHDSVFIQQRIDFPTEDMILWSARHDWNNPTEELKRISILKNSTELIHFYHRKSEWQVAFGAMSIISHSFLKYCYDKYEMDNLINVITCRNERMCFERIFAVIFYNEKLKLGISPPPQNILSKKAMFSMFNPANNTIVPIHSLYGNILNYIRWGYSFEEYLQNPMRLPIIKVWTGR